ncbi:Sulfotransferase domain-containing protein [Ekhidna lutea]|uniref:Sulfotransferase domain-containing protein n=1 Tax=Ekhidna lutea TaxID=447679 RepID=A0A239FI53_EKHLU|nr:sulfotransferase domain-containing protein [Ekhidna lutea]SNS55744.1 Sulfotransferase domain-containing protein [Ekhidna lutea]
MREEKKIDFMIVGAHKAGTSSLFQYLLEHPQLAGHKSSEFVYFLRDDIYKNGLSKSFKLFSNPDTQYVIAKCAGQMYSQEAMKRLYEHNPEVKLIMLLRNPVDRAYSAFWFNISTGRESKNDFLEAFNTPPDSFEDPILRRECDYLGRGLYFHHLKNILKYFPMENIHIGFFDDFKSDTKSYLQDVIHFMNLEIYNEMDTSIVHNSKSGVRSKTLAKLIRPGQKKMITHLFPDNLKRSLKKHLRKINETKLNAPPLDTHLRERLIRFYLEDIISLENLLNKKLDIWKGNY